MIKNVINFMRDRLKKALPKNSLEEPQAELFVYVESDKEDSTSFKSEAVSILLVRIEEETSLRQPDPYVRTSAKGAHQKVAPEIQLNLWVLFVARFKDYPESLQHLSDVIRYFQNHRVFNQENSPDLNVGVSQLILELVTPSFSEQNEIWGMLRSAYQPSALYKVKMIVFRDEDGQPLTPITELIQTTTQEPAR